MIGSEGTTVCGAFCEARNVVRNVSRKGSLLAGGVVSSSPVKRLKLGWFAFRKAIVNAGSRLFVVYEAEVGQLENCLVAMVSEGLRHILIWRYAPLVQRNNHAEVLKGVDGVFVVVLKISVEGSKRRPDRA